jgi:hypothetical protein
MKRVIDPGRFQVIVGCSSVGVKSVALDVADR